MPLFAERVRVAVSGTPGTGTITLGAAAGGYQTFAAGFPDKPALIAYTVEDGLAWESGYGTLNSTGTTLTRDNLIASSTGVFLTLSSSAFVMCSPTGRDMERSTIGKQSAMARGLALP